MWFAPGYPYSRAVEKLRRPIREQGVDFLYGELGEFYDPFEEHERAVRRRDPLLSPHGMLLALRTDDVGHAIEFFMKFGPLFLQRTQHRMTYGPGTTGPIDMNAFWALQLRFKLVTSLYAMRNESVDTLRGRFGDIATNQSRIRDSLQNFSHPGVEGPLIEAIRHFVPPWTAVGKSFDTWAMESSSGLRERAEMFVHAELGRAARGNEVVWAKDDEGRFRQVVLYDSLWSLIWELFAREASGDHWRICSHCGKQFYATRRNQKYCTTEIAALESKREWWKRHGKKWRRKREEKRT